MLCLGGVGVQLPRKLIHLILKCHLPIWGRDKGMMILETRMAVHNHEKRTFSCSAFQLFSPTNY